MSIFDVFKQIETQRSAPGRRITHIIAGLGNPGLQYEKTRHNAGYMAVSVLAEKHGIKLDRMKFRSDCGEAVIGDMRCLLMKPTTFMNNSGEAIAQAADFYKIKPEHILVLYDDISLAPGRLRIRRKGSAGGHNGIKSIIALLGTEEFPRIKIGVGQKPRADYDLADWVLSKFREEELEQLNPALERACSAAELIVQGRTDEAMNQYNA